MKIQRIFKRLRAFFLGAREFRSDVTTHFDAYDLALAYDLGREMAHRFTFRHWDG